MSVTYRKAVVTACVILLTTMLSLSQENPERSKRYVPPEFRASDSGIQALLDLALTAGMDGSFSKQTEILHDALAQCTNKGLVADKAIVEDTLASAYFSEGKLDDAKKQWANAMSDGIDSANSALQADVLVAMSGLAQAAGHSSEALDLATRAIDLARTGKSFYVQARALGELGRLQLVLGKTAEARASIEEALRIDRLNHYDWEPRHQLYLAWVTTAESDSNLDRAIEIATSARDLAIKKEDYLVFIQASTFIGQARVHKGDVNFGIQVLERAQDGRSDNGAPLFQKPSTYQAAVALPFVKVIFLEALAMAYQAGKRSEEAIRAWQELYDLGSRDGIPLAAAEAAHTMADIYQSKKEYDKAISYYALAQQKWTQAGNDQRRIDALTSESSLLFQQGQKDKALGVDEELLHLARAAKNARLQFIADLAIAEVLDGSEKADRGDSALIDAQSLITPEVTVTGVQPGLITEYYIRLAALYERRKDVIHELASLEKAITPAIALTTASGDAKNDKPLTWLVLQLQAKVPQYHLRDAAEKSYTAGQFADALLYFEVLRYFDETDAAWKSKSQEYLKGLNSDSTNNTLLQIPPKVVSQDGGAAFLAKNIETMGPIAEAVRLSILGVLTDYYLSHQQPDMAVKYARQALPSRKFNESATPTSWEVALSCELASALLLENDLHSAVEALKPCLVGAKKLGTPQLLRAAHQTNAWVLEASGKGDEAQESVQFLLNQTPDDPLEYTRLAQMKAKQGDRAAALAAWKRAIQLYESHNNVAGAADAHLALANMQIVGTVADPEERRAHLEAADALYRQLGSSEGRVKAEESLGSYYSTQKSNAKAQQYLDGALKVARDANRQDLEAHVLSQIGQAYDFSGDFMHAAIYYKNSADLFRELNDPSDEAFQLKNVASDMYSSHDLEGALSTILKARDVADTSDSWSAKYWTRRELAEMYGSDGQYQSGLRVLQEAKNISDSANQPLPSAWAMLTIAGYLETVGNWQEASEQVTLAIPVLQQSKDTDDEVVAYTELISIYGARESELKDVNKALEFYEKAYKVVATNYPDRAASLNLEIAEVFWDQGRFKDAIVKANEALEYYKRSKNELGEASALISLAEAQRSTGDLQTAANSLQLAEPLVLRAKNFYTTGRLYYGQAGLLRKQGRFKDAIDKYQEVIGLLEQFKSSSNLTNRRSVAETYSFIYDELIDTYYLLGTVETRYALSSAEKAFEYTELNKSRVFANSWGLAFIDGLRTQVPAQLQERERVLLARQAALDSELEESSGGTGSRPVIEVEKSLGAVKTEQLEVVDQLRLVSPAYAEARYPRPSTLEQMPIHSGELLVEFKMLHDSVLVWMIGGSERDAHLIAFYKVDRPRQWFEKHIIALRDAFNAGHPEEFEPKICEELFNALFPDAFAGHLKSAKSVIFVPDDVLFLLPFEMLSPNASRKEFVLLRTPTEYFPSAAVFRLARAAVHARSPWQEQFIGIADPITSPADERYVVAATQVTLQPNKGALSHQEASVVRGVSVNKMRSRGFDLERLPGTTAEVKSIAALFPVGSGTVEIRTGTDATKQRLMQTDLARFRFVHFATHGVLPVEAGIKEPALVLSYEGIDQDDMLLTLSEVFKLQLHAEMVVLSACNTGSGRVTRAEGVASLGTAFLAAGASSVTVSLWQVSDSSTAVLMQEFYRNILKGMPKAAALAAARSTLVTQGYDNPFFWAPFVITGE